MMSDISQSQSEAPAAIAATCERSNEVPENCGTLGERRPSVILESLRVGIRQPREPAARVHPDRKIAALDVRRADMRPIGDAGIRSSGTDAFGRTVANLERFRGIAVKLGQPRSNNKAQFTTRSCGRGGGVPKICGPYISA